MSIRIRREIRDLDDDEWSRIVEGFWVMKNLSTDSGQALYGENFRSYDDMTLKHAVAALDRRGDQAHLAPVFGPFHRAWLLEFENSLLSIDSKISSLPYWDFMKENLTTGEPPPADSIFSEKYLGSFVGQSPDYIIVDGSFSYWNISRDETTNVPEGRIRNVFGYLRHPLSVNKAPFLTRRGGHFCGYNMSLGYNAMWNGCLRVGDNIRDWTSCIDQYVHGPAHAIVAGSWRRPGQTFDSPSCAQWFGVISPPPPLSAAGTFIHSVSCDCFNCPTCPLNAENSFSNPCMCIPKEPKCGPLWTGLLNETMTTDGRKYNLTSSKSFLVDASVIQILGDLADPVASPNDPIFPFHHANVDRHFQTWMELNPAGAQSYWNFPTEGYAPGGNLDDIVSSVVPFYGLDPYINDSCSYDYSCSETPYTVRDIFEKFTGDATPYTYDTLLLDTQDLYGGNVIRNVVVRDDSTGPQHGLRSNAESQVNPFDVFIIFILIILVSIMLSIP